MTNFLIVVPKLAEFDCEYIFPIGLLYISASLKRHGCNVTCLNLCSHPESARDLLAGHIAQHKIDVVLTGGVAMHWHKIAEVLFLTKQIRPQCVTVAGGAIISSDPELALRNLPIDIGVIGEGELTVVELAEYFAGNGELSAIEGIVYNDYAEGTLLYTGQRPPIEDLDAQPLPDYESFDYDHYLKVHNRIYPFYEPRLFDIGEEQVYGEVLGSRSCPFDCTFCYHPLGKKYRQRAVAEVMKEVKYLIDRFGVNFICMLDELFSTDEKRIYQFIEEFSKLNIQWTAQWRVDNVNEAVMKDLKRSGMHTIGLGLESASDTVLTSMRKKTTRAKIDAAYAIAFQNGVRPGSSLIFGDIAETEQTMAESVDWWFDHPEYMVGMKFIMTLPDSFLYRHALEQGIITDKLGYITNQQWEINLMGVDQAKFFDLKALILYLQHSYANLKPGTILELQADTGGDRTQYRTLFKCPYCGEVSSYHYYFVESETYAVIYFAVVLCKHCDVRFKVESSACFPADQHPNEDFYRYKMGCIAV
jgi:anaerobic magnesium-protoporphyrin IX monomethyl ester cyclase